MIRRIPKVTIEVWIPRNPKPDQKPPRKARRDPEVTVPVGMQLRQQNVTLTPEEFARRRAAGEADPPFTRLIVSWPSGSATGGFADNFDTLLKADETPIPVSPGIVPWSASKSEGALVRLQAHNYWFFRRGIYSTEHELTANEVKALVLEKENKQKARIARALALGRQVEMLQKGGRGPIPDDVKVYVWQRDEGKCVRCGSNRNLEFDHVVPVVMGGANTARNLQLLCEGCNRAKGGSLV